MSNLKAVLDRLEFKDDAKVAEQLAEQARGVRTRLAPIKRKILVLSGKGGVGKSTVTSQLALALARKGEKVAIVDADLNGPSIPRMLGLSGRALTLAAGGAIPPEGPLGIKVASMSFLTAPDSPVRWKGPLHLTPVWLGMMESAVLREFLADIAWGKLDTLLFDLPPGAAADKPPAIANLVSDISGAVVVTTSSQVALEVVRNSILYARDLKIPILGLVENMAGLFHGDCSGLAAEMKTPLLARIPMEPELNRSLEQGSPLPENHPISRAFMDLAIKLEGASR